MTTEHVNSFDCDTCGYWEEQPADQSRSRMSIECLEYGETDDRFAKYRCTCGAESWSRVLPSDADAIEAEDKLAPWERY